MATYQPQHFRRDDPAELQAFMQAVPLATLITFGDGRLHVSHVPLLFDADEGTHGVLIGHLAAANPQAQHYDPAVEAVAVFGGPNAYVSPNWYATKVETHKVVPTWNYMAVYATGALAFVDDADAKRAVVARLTATHEASQPAPWSIDDAPPDFVAAQLRGIRAFTFRIARLEGKWKLSQNRPEPDRTGVIAGLDGQRQSAADAVADAMRRLYGRD